MVGEGRAGNHSVIAPKPNGFLFSSQPLCTFLTLQTEKAVNALLCCPSLTHTSSTFIMARSAVVEEMSSGYVMKHANKIYIYQMTSQGLMLHKPNSRALCKGISLISAEDGFLSLSESALMLLTIKQHPWHLSHALSRDMCDLN